MTSAMFWSCNQLDPLQVLPQDQHGELPDAFTSGREPLVGRPSHRRQDPARPHKSGLDVPVLRGGLVRPLLPQGQDQDRGRNRASVEPGLHSRARRLACHEDPVLRADREGRPAAPWQGWFGTHSDNILSS